MQKVTSNTASTLAAVIAVVLLAVLTYVDFAAGVRFNPSLTYATLLLSCFIVKNRRFLWFLTIASLLSCLIVPLVGEDDTRALIHRALISVTILATAVVLNSLIRAWRQLKEDSEILNQNFSELGSRETEIARQNEELLSQTEELERQSEELRVINDELATREKMLESLLDLSRSLNAELTEDQVMGRVCETLGGLINGRASAAAILEKKGDRIKVQCHSGFGEGGIVADEWPYEKSFASLVLAQGQAGYLEDVSLRSDLRIPQPKEGEPFVGVLGAPLRVHGHYVGALEAYTHDKRPWTSEQIALIESIAAQTSISLETARLFQEIERERRRFEAVFRTLPIGVFVADDPSCERVRGNQAAAAMYNAPVDANFSPLAPLAIRIRRSIFRAGQPVPLDSHPLIQSVRAGRDMRGEELEVQFPDGRNLTLLVSAAPIHSPDGEISGGVCAFVDITSLKRIEQELDRRRREAEEASVRKTRFLAAVSHDIRTPANAISLLAELIQRSGSNPAWADGIPELAKDLRASALSLVDLVSDVLDVARFDSGKVDLQETEFWLGEAIAEEVRQIGPLAQEKSLRLEVEPIDPPIRLRADRIKLGRVIGNLLGNAIKFTEKGEARIVAGLDDQRRVRIDVIDTGIGIAADHLPHIFDEFFQLRNPERDRNKGMGLGLAICKRLVEAMDGTLETRSQPGQGSVFTVTLPAGSVIATPSEVSAVSKSGAKDHTLADLAGVRVLLVEDHHSTRRATMQMLHARGAIVAEAPDARSAFHHLRTSPPQVLLLDMMLPDQDGEEVLKSLQNDRPEPLECIVVLTGDATTQRMENVKRLGADGLVIKPVDFNRLLEQIHHCRSTAQGTRGNGDSE